MRLICPNCGAQYEVPEDVIPDGGRDVQCSNCGDTWFQKHPSQDRELSEELEQSLDEAHWEDDAPESGDSPPPESEPSLPDPSAEAAFTEMEAQAPAEEEDATQWDGFDDPDQDGAPDYDEDTDAAFDTEPDDDYDDEDAAESESAEEPPAPQPRELDPAVSEILRQEAEHEQQARRAESSGLEMQPDLGLEQTEGDETLQDREARLRMARMRGLSEEEALGAAAGLAANASRRDLLPDIEEINSSLRKDTDRAAASAADGAIAPPEPRRGGFSRGFLTMVLLFVVLILVYIYADQISATLPAIGGIMDSYVGAVDGLRVWLDQQILSLMGWLDGMASETPADN